MEDKQLAKDCQQNLYIYPFMLHRFQRNHSDFVETN